MNIQDISNLSLGLCFLLLIIPIGISYFFNLPLIKSTLIAVSRMSIQLFLMAIFLTYLFEWDISWLNVIWLAVMVAVATFSVVRSSELNIKVFLLPTFFAFILSEAFVLIYFNKLILNLTNIFEARYLIVIGGMLLGNSLRGNIIGINEFYKDIKRNQERYLYHLAAGATVIEAVMPYFREGIVSALRPSIASMATIGVVFLPGMMTGQILGGATPITAIKYQIAIIIAIFTSVTITITLTILFTLKNSFDDFGILKKDIFNK